MQQLVREFVPAADEVGLLQNERTGGPEARLFRKIAEQGHYGGRTKPTATRQGIYAATPSGILLASANTNEPHTIADLMRKALGKWKTLDRSERLQADAPERSPPDRFRLEARYPEGGLVLQVFSRDLPRGDAGEGAGRDGGAAWNTDFAWFTKAEAATLVPAEPEVGVEHAAPARLVRRIVTRHLVDNVRGQTKPFSGDHVEKAELTLTVDAVDGARVHLRIDGASRAVEKGVWQVRGWREPAKEIERGYESRLRGRAVWNSAEGRFDRFEMVAIGPRWGATKYNVRADDLGPAPMGVAFRMARTTEGPDRVAPAFAWGYFD